MALADLSLQSHGEVVVARLDGEIDMSNAVELGEAMSRRVANDALGLVIDLTDVAYLDSAAIKVIYDLRERLRARGQEIRVVIAPGSLVAEALRVAAVPAVVGAADTVDAALQSMGAS
jgi:anti-anti-sigma factor